MSINAVSSNYYSLSLSDILATQVSGTKSCGSTQSGSSVTSAIGQSESAEFSNPAMMYSKLQELAQTDPEKLKEVCAKIAEQLQSASEEQDGFQSNMLSDLAEKFQNVADGGDVSQLKPPEPPSGGGPGQGPIEKYQQQQSQSLVDMLGTQSNKKRDDGMDSLMSSIMDQIDAALSKSVTS